MPGHYADKVPPWAATLATFSRGNGSSKTNDWAMHLLRLFQNIFWKPISSALLTFRR